jgi:hypothetical protein
MESLILSMPFKAKTEVSMRDRAESSSFQILPVVLVVNTRSLSDSLFENVESFFTLRIANEFSNIRNNDVHQTGFGDNAEVQAGMLTRPDRVKYSCYRNGISMMQIMRVKRSDASRYGGKITE